MICVNMNIELRVEIVKNELCNLFRFHIQSKIHIAALDKLVDLMIKVSFSSNFHAEIYTCMCILYILQKSYWLF